MKKIATIRTDFPTKFGIPRQSGLASLLRGTIVFEPEYRDPNALRGLEGFSHLWIIWEFSESKQKNWSPTVRPPRLGGNAKLGVFATRSPFRPNPIGLSCVQIERIESGTKDGTVIHVSGADLMDGTPIYDIKPYLPYTDSRPHALAGFTAEHHYDTLTVEIPHEEAEKMTPRELESLKQVLEQDPRPHYHDDPARVYGFPFAGHEIKFRVSDRVLTVIEIK